MALRACFMLIATCVFPALGHAQSDCDGDGFPNTATRILFEDFEDALPSGWTTSGLWNVTSECQSSFGPAVAGEGHAYFGIVSQCNYANGSAVAGELTTAPFTIPNGTQTLIIQYDSRTDFELSNGFDFFGEELDITLENLDNGITIDLDATRFRSFEWRQEAFAVPFGVDTNGDQFQLTFRFNSVDGVANEQLGWQIDNLEVLARDFPDTNANNIHDDCELFETVAQLDFEEGDVSDLIGVVVNGSPGFISSLDGPGGLQFTVAGTCLTTDPLDECGNGDFVLQFSDAVTCNFATNLQRNSNYFVLPVEVLAGRSTILTFCSKYDAEGGSFDGTYTGSGDSAWGGAGFDRAGLAIFESDDAFFVSSVGSLDVSGTTTAAERGQWKQYTFDFTGFPSGTYLVAFAFDSDDTQANETLGWQVDNIVVRQTARGLDLNSNGVLDDTESFIYNESNGTFFNFLSQALQDPALSANDTLIATPLSLSNIFLDFSNDLLDDPRVRLESLTVGETSNGGRFTLPAGSTTIVRDDSRFASVGFPLIVQGQLTLEAGTSASFAPTNVLLSEFGSFTLKQSAVFSGSIIVDTGTVNYFGGAARGLSIEIGNGESRNGMADSRLQGFGTTESDTRVFSDGQVVVQADMQMINDLRVDPGGQVLIQSGVLSLFGDVDNAGEIIGDTFTPVGRAVTDNGGRVSGHGVFFADDTTLSQPSALRANNPAFVLNAGGDLDIQIDDNGRFEFAQAELRLNALGSQTFEALSRDRGPSRDGLDPSLEGSFPIGTLRVGPLRTRATLVDNNDNDTGASSPEVIYARNVIVEPGATLDLTSHVVYYESSNVLGVVLNPSNLIALEESCPSDVNSDGRVDIEDLLRVLREFNSSGLGDTDGDNDTDIEDLLTVLREFGTECQ